MVKLYAFASYGLRNKTFMMKVTCAVLVAVSYITLGLVSLVMTIHFLDMFFHLRR